MSVLSYHETGLLSLVSQEQTDISSHLGWDLNSSRVLRESGTELPAGAALAAGSLFTKRMQSKQCKTLPVHAVHHSTDHL